MLSEGVRSAEQQCAAYIANERRKSAHKSAERSLGAHIDKMAANYGDHVAVLATVKFVGALLVESPGNEMTHLCSLYLAKWVARSMCGWVWIQMRLTARATFDRFLTRARIL